MIVWYDGCTSEAFASGEPLKVAKSLVVMGWKVNDGAEIDCQGIGQRFCLRFRPIDVPGRNRAIQQATESLGDGATGSAQNQRKRLVRESNESLTRVQLQGPAQ